MSKRSPGVLTAAHVKKFQQYMEHWLGVLGLVGWRVSYSSRPAPDDALAQVACDFEGRQAVYQLGLDWQTDEVNDETLSSTALHEALHIFLHDFKIICGNPRADDSILVNAEHGVVNLLEKLLFAKEKSRAQKK